MSPSVKLISSLLLLLAAWRSCQAAPGQNRAVRATANPFDGGELGRCEVPTTSLCSIEYPVPISISRLAGIIEEQIMDEIRHRDDLTCRETYKTVLCNIRFPRCKQLQESTSQYLQVELNNQNCSVLQDACPNRVAGALVNLCNYHAHTEVSSSECSQVSELVGDYNFQYCNIEDIGSNLVTGWMFEYMKYVDQRSGGLVYDNAKCGGNLATFMCNFHGQCSSDRTEVEFINSHEECNNVLSCYSDSDELLVEGELVCHLWPQEHLNVEIITNEVEENSNPIGSEMEVGATTDIPADILQNSGLNINIEEFVGSATSTRQYTVGIACAALFTVFLL